MVPPNHVMVSQWLMTAKVDLTTFSARRAPARSNGGFRTHHPHPERLPMEARVADIAGHQASELVWLLEHPPLYTSGTSGTAGDLLEARASRCFRPGRGGQLTYHGSGAPAHRLCDARPEGAPA